MADSVDRAARDCGCGEPIPAPEPPSGKVSLAARVYGVLMLVSGAFNLGVAALLVVLFAIALRTDPSELSLGEQTTLSLGLIVAAVLIALALAAGGVRLGRALLKSDRRRVATTARPLIALVVARIVVDIMLSGVGLYLWTSFAQLAILIALHTTIDPTLRAERASRRREACIENAQAAAIGMEGRDLTGKGYLKLNFFTLFWEFVACCFLGLVLEVIWHMVVVDPGVYQDRAGLLWGPFSPIYGFGAVLVTLALNRLYDKNLLVIFAVSAVVGGGFEAAVSLFMQLGFGATAWDYSSYTILGMPDPIAALMGGRTCTMFMGMWGALGLVWVKAFLPLLLRGVNLIPWRMRYGLTAVCALAMLMNGIVTLEALDRWFERERGVVAQTAAGAFFDEHYGNDYMARRFESMTIEPKHAARLSGATAGARANG